jgi:hypothetical protein
MNNDNQNGQFPPGPPAGQHPSIPPQYARYQQQQQQQHQDSQLAYLLANAAARNQQERRLSGLHMNLMAEQGNNPNAAYYAHQRVGPTTAEDRLALAVALLEYSNNKRCIVNSNNKRCIVSNNSRQLCMKFNDSHRNLPSLLLMQR